MNENKTRRLGIVNIILILIAIVAQLVVVIKTDSGLFAIAAIIAIVALLYAGFYAVSGYKKSAAYLYKIYFLLFAIALIGDLISAISAGITISTLIIIIDILTLAGVIILGFVPNLGHEKSKSIAEILCAAFAVMFVVSIAVMGDFEAICKSFGNLVIALLSWLMVYEKFKDKFIRKGTED